MKDWYQNKMETGVSHRNYGDKKRKKIWLTNDQAKIHGDKVEKCPPPKTISDCAAPEDHSYWQEEQQAKKVSKPDNKKGEKTKP